MQKQNCEEMIAVIAKVKVQMFWKSKKKEKEGDWNTAHKNLKPLKNNEEIQHHQKEDN